jgi:membrane protease YdiL (CAAX protease family)
MNPAGLSHLWSSSDTWIFTIILSATFPAAGILLLRRLLSPGQRDGKQKKLRIYAFIILSEWAFVAALLWITNRHALTIVDLGEYAGDVTLTLAVTLALLAVITFMAYFNFRQLRRSAPDKLEAEIGALKYFLPESKPEIAVFAGIAFTAGICEELLYRGWLQNLIAAGTGSVWAGLILGAVIFGCGHAYQGKSGMIQTGIIGLIFGGVFLLTGGLIAGQILHVSIDAVNGIVGGYALSLLKANAAGPGK